MFVEISLHAESLLSSMMISASFPIIYLIGNDLAEVYRLIRETPVAIVLIQHHSL